MVLRRKNTSRKLEKPAEVRWCISLIRAIPQIGSVYAPDEGTARQQAIAEFRIPDALQFKLVVQREG